MDDITKTQQSFAIKALHNPEHRFADLYHLICRGDWIAFALHAVLGNMLELGTNVQVAHTPPPGQTPRT